MQPPQLHTTGQQAAPEVSGRLLIARRRVAPPGLCIVDLLHSGIGLGDRLLVRRLLGLEVLLEAARAGGRENAEREAKQGVRCEHKRTGGHVPQSEGKQDVPGMRNA